MTTMYIVNQGAFVDGYRATVAYYLDEPWPGIRETNPEQYGICYDAGVETAIQDIRTGRDIRNGFDNPYLPATAV